MISLRNMMTALRLTKTSSSLKLPRLIFLISISPIVTWVIVNKVTLIAFHTRHKRNSVTLKKIDINLFGDCEDLPNSLFQDVEFRESCMILDLIPETDGFDWVFLKIGKSPSPSPSPSSSPSPSPSPSLFSSSSSSPSPSPSSSPSPAPSSSPSPSSCTSSSSPFWIYLLMFGAGAIVGCFLVLFVFPCFNEKGKRAKTSSL